MERLRYGDRILSTSEIIGSIEDIRALPLLFIPFIENCFKHGTKENNQIEVNISFEIIKDEKLIFKVENRFAYFNKPDVELGIGIQN